MASSGTAWLGWESTVFFFSPKDINYPPNNPPLQNCTAERFFGIFIRLYSHHLPNSRTFSFPEKKSCTLWQSLPQCFLLPSPRHSLLYFVSSVKIINEQCIIRIDMNWDKRRWWGQGGVQCCSSHGVAKKVHSWATEQQQNKKRKEFYLSQTEWPVWKPDSQTTSEKLLQSSMVSRTVLYHVRTKTLNKSGIHFKEKETHMSALYSESADLGTWEGSLIIKGGYIGIPRREEFNLFLT